MGTMREMFGTDEKSEREGIWIDYGQFRVRIARAGGTNKKYQKALEEMSRPHRRAMELKIMDDDLATDILRKVYAETVVRAWETKQDGEWVAGVEIEEGEMLPATSESYLKAFREFPDLFFDLQAQASELALFRARLREDAAGN